jgi:alpha-aminoadipic semialdehyde synthase
VQIQVTGGKEHVSEVVDHITAMAEGHANADAQVTSETASGAPASAEIRVMSPRRVLLLGSGRVCAPVVKLLGQHDNVHITIASDVEAQARDLMKHVHGSRSTFAQLRMPHDNEKLGQLIASSDVVISLLPATMHTMVRYQCDYMINLLQYVLIDK